MLLNRSPGRVASVLSVLCHGHWFRCRLLEDKRYGQDRMLVPTSSQRFLQLYPWPVAWHERRRYPDAVATALCPGGESSPVGWIEPETSFKYRTTR